MRRAVQLKSREEIARIRAAGRIVHAVLAQLRAAARPGVSTAELDELAAQQAQAQGARPAFKGYLGFPGSLCASLNEEVVHGIPSRRRRLAEGDLLKLDFGVAFEGFYADAAITVPIGRVSPLAERLVQTTRDCLEAAIGQLRPGGRISDLGAAVQRLAEARGFSVVRDFVGHGIGRSLHEAPQVPNYRGAPGPDPVLEPGLVLAIEPMVNAGGPQTEVLADRWTAVTRDRQPSAHFEHTVALTEEGPVILTAP